MRRNYTRLMALETGLTVEEKTVLLRIARESVLAAVSGKSYSPGISKYDGLNRKAGAFVTLHERGELRGCIGYVEARLPISETVAQTAAKAAISDPRFNAVTPSETEDIELEISVLSPLKRVINTEEIIVGKHGVVIERGFYRGLLLPQVATENGWNREEFLRYTCMKAGLGEDCYNDAETQVYIFTADVFSEKDTGLIQEVDVGKKQK